VGDGWRWWVVAILPRRVAAWLWRLDIPLGSWAPYVLGQSLGARGHRVENKNHETQTIRDD
jgi:hypothetical protein